MRWFVGLVGLFWIIVGISGLVATRKTTLALCNWVKNTRRQTLGLISLIFGVLLLISASSTQAPWFILALGIIACLKGAAVILMPAKKLQAIIDWWLAAPEIVYKGWAALLLALGVAMFHIIRRF